MTERENYSKVREGRKTDWQNERKYCKEKEKRQFPRSRCSVHSQRFSQSGLSQIKPVLAYDILNITRALIIVP